MKPWTELTETEREFALLAAKLHGVTREQLENAVGVEVSGNLDLRVQPRACAKYVTVMCGFGAAEEERQRLRREWDALFSSPPSAFPELESGPPCPVTRCETVEDLMRAAGMDGEPPEDPCKP